MLCDVLNRLNINKGRNQNALMSLPFSPSLSFPFHPALSPGISGGEVMLLIDQSGCTNKAVRPC